MVWIIIQCYFSAVPNLLYYPCGQKCKTTDGLFYGISALTATLAAWRLGLRYVDAVIAREGASDIYHMAMSVHPYTYLGWIDVLIGESIVRFKGKSEFIHRETELTKRKQITPVRLVWSDLLIKIITHRFNFWSSQGSVVFIKRDVISHHEGNEQMDPVGFHVHYVRFSPQHVLR